MGVFLRLKLILGIVVLGLFYVAGTPLWAGLPNPPDQVLIIWTNDSCDGGNPGYAQDMVTNLEAAFAALGANAPTVKTIETNCSTTSEVGIQSALTTAGYTLSQFCEVYDLRFLSWPGVQACTAGGDSSMITNTGANNDTQLYLAYLAQGGHLILTADNAGFCNRDAAVVSFVAAATGCNLGWNVNDTISNATYTGPYVFSAPLQGSYNTLTAYGGDYPGYISTGSICNATALTTSGSDVFDMLWTSGQLIPGSGSLELNMDTNGLANPVANYIPYWQNVYAMNGTCYNFTLTKTVNPPTVCVGGSVTFTVCLKNTGTQSMTNPQITDAIPSCMSYVSSTPAGGSASGNNFTWTMAGTLASGATTCVNIVAQANNTNCP